MTVVATDDARVVLDQAQEFLSGDAVSHNVIFTLLEDRASSRDPGRYWIALADARPVGIVFQSPLDFFAALTPMPAEAVAAVVGAITQTGLELPGIGGEAATAVCFAGEWTERTRSSAVPVHRQRIHEVRDVVPPVGVPGRLRPATSSDRDLVVGWLRAFYVDTGEGASEPETTVDRRLPAGHFWLWDDEGPVSMAALTPPTAGIVRVGAVYTPPERRARGYAGVCVAGLSADVLARGQRCILYTDLANATSNALYRRIGYRGVSEVLRFRFTKTAAADGPDELGQRARGERQGVRSRRG